MTRNSTEFDYNGSTDTKQATKKSGPSWLLILLYIAASIVGIVIIAWWWFLR